MPSEDFKEGFDEGWRAAMQRMDYNERVRRSTTKGEVRKTARRAYEPKKTKRAPSAYNKRYSAAFKQVASRYKTKAGKWKKDGFKRAAAAARKIAKRG